MEIAILLTQLYTFLITLVPRDDVILKQFPQVMIVLILITNTLDDVFLLEEETRF